MEERSLSTTSTTNTASHPRPHEGRSVWVLTLYGFAGLAVFGVLIYYFCSYVTQ